MTRNFQAAIRWLVAVAMLALPVVLLLSSVRSLGELRETKSVYLRNRAATIAARLESLHPEQLADDPLTVLGDEEPALVDLVIYDSEAADPDDEVLRSLWRGEALFHTATLKLDGEEIYRAYVPFHAAGKVRIARIDLSVEAADYLVEHGRYHMVLSLMASLALVAFTLYFLWSERRAMELGRRQLALEHLARLGKMSAVLAHEIRNPLGTIKGFVQLAREQAGDGVARLLEPVLEETARLEKLVADLLAYGRPRTPEIRRLEWPRLAEQLEAHARETIGERPVRFDLRSELETLETDPELLLQVLLNLVRNSIEAVAEQADGEVVLTASRRNGNGIRIVVEDNGPGLPPEVRRKLFEPFTTTKVNGTGLGLSISRKLAEALGGTLRLADREPRGVRAELYFKK